ncbi:MAG: hypothetical protein SF069_01200 [Phycisphaerae bacterium]|nr:hypothetical protein [Phycisphaerae bacterium]
MRKFLCASAALALSAPALANVFINEVFTNPPGSLDDTREFIELMGTPGKKLDGYAIAAINGAMTRFYPLGSIPPAPLGQEVDEFFSLDGLSLGPNGILVIAIGSQNFYPTMIPDSNFARWESFWNGFLDTNGKLENDGSPTYLLIRNRPGATQATHPFPPAVDLRWGKDIQCDSQLFTPVVDPQDGLQYDQWGDGNLDTGGANGFGGTTLDVKGSLTPNDVADDLEVVDEISYENERGWEYDLDGRLCDVGSANLGLPERRVHTLDDPQGFNPDAISRVDYRTKGAGWAAVAGATGQGPGGNNWQDTATEQWVRGESIVGSGGVGNPPQMYFDNTANTNPDSIQPFWTNVPKWLNDGVGADYNFAAANTYQIMAGRVNPLALAYIPGDADRDGDADAADIAKIAAVFGDEDWIFSNSFSAAPEGDSGDPATQTRPWDVDQTGDNGVEPSDLQWTLNFLGNATGRIVGRTYDGTTPTPAGGGVHLNPNLPVVCTITASASTDLTQLQVNDTAEITVAARVSGGAIVTSGQENGVMQYVHDIEIAAGGIVEVTSVQAVGPFAATRPGLAALQGVGGDRGIDGVNGHTTSFTQGLTAAAPLYRVNIRAIGEGSTTLAVSAAQQERLLASTPGGLKVGRTNNNGNPGAVAYPVLPLNISVSGGGFAAGDMNCDGFVTVGDIGGFVLALTNPSQYAIQFPACDINLADVNGDGFVTVGDIGSFVALLTGN